MLKRKNIIISLSSLLIAIIIALTAFRIYSSAQQNKDTAPKAEDKLSVVAVSFVEYDLTRQIAGDKVDVELLMIPGSNYHLHTMTEVDKEKIANCDLFIYTKEPSESWISDILNELGKNAPYSVIASKGCSLRKNRNLINENIFFHPQSPLKVFLELSEADDLSSTDLFDESVLGDYDTHVWTSLKYGKGMCKNIYKALCELDEKNTDFYTANYNSYCAKLDNLEVEYCKTFDSNYTDTIYFAGNFSFYYMCERYGIDYQSVIPYCSFSQKYSEEMVQYIINEIKENNAKVFYYDQFDSKEIVDRISAETGAEALPLYSCHTVTISQLNDGATYLDFMTKNLENLKKSL